MNSNLPVHSRATLNEIARDLVDAAVSIRVHYWGVMPEHRDNPLHRHSFFEACYVVAGEGTYHEGEMTYPLRPGTLFLSRPGFVHQIRSEQGMFLPFVAFELQPNGTSDIWLERFAQIERTGRFVVQEAGESETALIWRALLRTAGQSQADAEDVNRLALALLLSMPNTFESESPRPARRPHRPHASLIHQATLYVRDNLSGSLKLDETAAYLHVSGRHLSRVFAEELGMTFNHYVREERVREAARLLRDSGLSIKEISDRTGFGSVHYFTRIFSGMIGASPAAYRTSPSASGVRFV